MYSARRQQTTLTNQRGPHSGNSHGRGASQTRWSTSSHGSNHESISRQSESATKEITWVSNDQERKPSTRVFPQIFFPISRRMLRPRKVSQVLGMAKIEGIRSIMMIKGDGTLIAASNDEGFALSSVSQNDSDSDFQAGILTNAPFNGKVTAAIAASMWTSTQAMIRPDDDDDVDCLLVECEGGRIAITSMSQNLLCCVGEPSVEFGMMRTVACRTAKYLESELQNAAQAISASS